MRWYEIKNKADKAEIWIYEYIGEDFWSGNGITAKNFQKDLAAIKASQIDLHINSPGGDVFDGITIYNLLKQHSANVTTYIDGLAASIASVIALAGDEVFMAENAIYMIHNPWGFSMGDSNDMRKTADVLDKIRGSMVNTYTSKTGKPEDEIIALLNEETWLDAEEASNLGFIDKITEKMDLAACAEFIPVMSKMGFKHIPNFSSKRVVPSEREIERILREKAGCSQKMAKIILAEGYPTDYRDDDPGSDTTPATEQNHRDDDPAAHRDDVQPAQASKVVNANEEPAKEGAETIPVSDPPKPTLDWLAELKVRAERIAPSKTM